jgi:hypothetical protein
MENREMRMLAFIAGVLAIGAETELALGQG